MRRRAVRAVSAGLAVAVCAFAATAQEQQPTFRGGARFVRVDVYPTDADGRPVEGLTGDDFEVYEDGRLQTIDSFEFIDIQPEPEAIRIDPTSQAEAEAMARDPRARLFGIVLDTGHVSVGGSRELRRPLVNMLDRLIGPRDMFGVITTQVPPASFTFARRTLTVAEMMEKAWTWGTYDQILPQDAVERMFDDCFGSVTGPATSRGSQYTRELIARHREQQTLAFLEGLVDKLASIREERKFLVVVTQGWRLFGPNRSMLEEIMSTSGATSTDLIVQQGRIGLGTPPAGNPNRLLNRGGCTAEAQALLTMDSQQTHRALMEKAQRANVAFYPVDPRGLTPFDQPISHGVISATEETSRVQARVTGLRTLAENTDGRAFVLSNDIDAQFAELAEGLSRYYLLGYYSSNTTFDGRFRKLTVKVRKPGVRLTARRGYYAPTEAEAAALAAGKSLPSTVAADPALGDALSRLADVDARGDIFVQTTHVPGGVMVSAELGVAARTAAAWADGGEMRFLITAGDETITESRPLAAMRSGVLLRVPVGGDGAARIEVRARAAGRGDGSAADRVVQIPAAVPSVLGVPLSFRGIARALQPAADGRYRRTERVTIEAPLAVEADPAGARLLDRTGTALEIPVTTQVRIDDQGTRWLVATLSPAPLGEGDYVVEMEATADGTPARRLFAIRVVR